MKIKTRVKKHSLKLIASILAVLLWVYVQNSEKVKFEKTVQLEYKMPREMIFFTRPPQEIIFMIEGPRAFVKNVSEREDKLIIDLNKANPRRLHNFSVDINPTHLNLPFGMIVERVLPRKLQIHLEKKISKLVPVRPKFSGQGREAFILNKFEVAPAEVEISGPLSVIGKLKEIQTKNIDFETLVGNSEVALELKLTDERLSIRPETSLKLIYELKTRPNVVLRDLPVRLLTQDKKIISKIKTATVKLFVPEEIKDRSNLSSSIQLWADVPQKVKNKMKVPLRVITPPGIHVIEVSPKSIIVNVQ